MRLEDSQISCGVAQLYSLNDSSRAIVRDFAENVADEIRYEENPPAFVVFSDAVKYGNGRRLAQYINCYKLGKIYATQPKINENSKRKIQVWTWSVDWDAVVRHTKVKTVFEEDDDE